ncbi:MAG: phage tail tube protein [Sphingomonadaceae bacterium]|nr:phage tail tube protein [Sphingomonadaceae bacterium]
MSALAGTAFVTIDGKSYSIVGEGTYRVSSETRESLLGQDGYHGYKAMPAAGKISWKGRDSSGVSVAAIAAASNATVTLELANGKTIIGRNMVRVGDPIEVNTEDATFTVDFEGPEVTEN